MGDWSWIPEVAKYAVGAAGAAGANEATQGAYRRILENLQARFGDYASVPAAGYTPVTAPTLGPSEVGRIQVDPEGKLAAEATLAQLDEISAGGGLNDADRAALAEIERKLNMNATARRKAVANQFAARGQLGAGAELAMGLDAAQDAAENANARGNEIAGQAQQRAMKAVLEKGAMARAMTGDDWARKKDAALAEDAIRRYNASMGVDVGKYNNAIKGQAFDDSMKRLGGKHAVTGQMNEALLGSGKQNANTIAGMAYGGTGLIDSLASSGRSTGGGGYTTSTTGAEHSTTGTGEETGNWSSMYDDENNKEH